MPPTVFVNTPEPAIGGAWVSRSERLLRPKRSAGTLGAIPLIVWLTGFKKAGNTPLFKDWVNGT